MATAPTSTTASSLNEVMIEVIAHHLTPSQFIVKMNVLSRLCVKDVKEHLSEMAAARHRLPRADYEAMGTATLLSIFSTNKESIDAYLKMEKDDLIPALTNHILGPGATTPAEKEKRRELEIKLLKNAFISTKLVFANRDIQRILKSRGETVCLNFE